MLRRLSLLLFVVLFAAACSGDGDDGAADDAPSTTTTSVAVDEADSSTTTTVAEEGALIVTFGDDTLTTTDLTGIAAALGAGEADALNLWLLTTAIELDLADGGRPLTDLDLADAELQLGAVDGSDPFLVRATAVFTVARAIAEEDVAGVVESLEPPEVLCSSHILLETEAEAADLTEIAAALAQDSDDFAELAVAYSTGPSGPSGGDLGCTPTEVFVPEFGDAARASGVGVTGPVETQFGWHVIQVRSIGPGTMENHPEMSTEDIDALQQQLFDVEVGAYLDGLTTVAATRVTQDAEIDPAYGVWDESLGQLVNG